MTLAFIKKWWFVLLYLAIYFIAINAVVLNRFWQFEAFYFDHGIFDSSVWQAAQGKVPLIDHLESAPIRQWGDHFTPSLYLLTPIYIFTSSYEPILVVQNLLVVGSALVLFILASRKIKSRLLILALVVAYTLFIGLQNAIIANLHTELITLLTLALTLLFLDRKKWVRYWLFLLLTFGTKQNYASIGVGLGIYLFFTGEKKQGVASVIASLAYYYLATNLLIPFFGQRPYWYGLSSYSPMEALKQFFYPPIKVETMFISFLNFGFLPLLVPAFWPAIFQDFLTRFVFNTGSSRWDLGLHYNATLSVLLCFGAIMGAVKLESIKKLQRLSPVLGIIIIGIVLVLHRFIYRGPLGLAYNPDFYAHTEKFDNLRAFLKSVPQANLVMTQNNLASYLSHESNVMLLRGDYYNYSPDIIVIDNHSGQSANAFWPSQEVNVQKMVETLNADPHYQRVGQLPGPVYWKKI